MQRRQAAPPLPKAFIMAESFRPDHITPPVLGSTPSPEPELNSSSGSRKGQALHKALNCQRSCRRVAAGPGARVICTGTEETQSAAGRRDSSHRRVDAFRALPLRFQACHDLNGKITEQSTRCSLQQIQHDNNRLHNEMGIDP